MLPTELVVDIFSYLEQRELKAIRLVCIPFETLASPLLFTKAYIAARRGVIDVFKQITSHPVLSNYIREVIYDASWFEPSVAASLENFSQTKIAGGPSYSSTSISDAMRQGYDTYVRLFYEQERILSDELPAALEVAFKVSRDIRRVTFADFSRNAYILGDRVEDFGDVFHSRCNSDSWIDLLTGGTDLQRLPRKFGGFRLLMKALSASESLQSVKCFAVGDGASSSESSSWSGIPHIFFSSRCEGLPRGWFDGLRYLRKLDLSILVMRTTADESEKLEVDALKELLNMADCLEELRLVRSDYPASSQTRHMFDGLSMALVWGSKTWKNLRTLELRHFELRSSEVLHILRRHRHCLRKVDIDDLVLLDHENWISFCESVHLEYPSLIIAPYSWMGYRFLLLGNTDSPEGEPVRIDWRKIERMYEDDGRNTDDDDWIEVFGDNSGSYSDNESFTDNVSTTSEELEFSTGSDDESDLD